MLCDCSYEINSFLMFSLFYVAVILNTMRQVFISSLWVWQLSITCQNIRDICQRRVYMSFLRKCDKCHNEILDFLASVKKTEQTLVLFYSCIVLLEIYSQIIVIIFSRRRNSNHNHKKRFTVSFVTTRQADPHKNRICELKAL